MDKIVVEKYNPSWRGVAWRGVRACFAYLLTVLIILSQIHITAFASGDIAYIGSDGRVRTISEAQATSIASGTTTWGSSGDTKWYVADGTVNIGSRVEINGSVHLILKDGSNLTVEGGIHLTGANTLTIYGQSGGTGHLTAQSVEQKNAGIGSNVGESNSSLTINGGNITAKGGDFGAGIGGGYGGSGGNITVSGGIVTANGKDGSAGIGGGYGGSGGNITINGGDVKATGGYNGAGIGGGYRGSGENITINGGNITATGGDWGAGIGGGFGGLGGTVTVSGGIVTATGKNGTAGIGGGAFGTGTNGSAIIYTNRIADQSQSNSWDGIIFDENGDNGKVYGTVTLNGDLTIPTGKTLEIDSEKELVIPAGKTLTNDGTINNNGTITNNGRIVNNGTIQNNGTITNSGQIEGMGSISGNPVVQTPPSIGVQPQNQTVNAGESFSFTVTATGTLPLTYQWQEKTNSADWSDIASATSETYTVSSVSIDRNGNKYRCKVTNSVGEVISNEASLTVNQIPMPTPSANIDYSAEQLTGLTAGAVYKIAAAGSAEEEITSSADGKIDIREVWFNKTISIKTKATNNNFADSLPQEIAIPSRPSAPNGLQGENETFAGENNGKITGTTAQMEYKLADGNWTPCLDNSTSSLAPGTYQVRIAATDSSFAGAPVQIEIATGEDRTYTLNITAPIFDATEYGYTQPAAKPITIQNTGNSTSTIIKVELNNTESFDIAGSGDRVEAGGSITTYTIQPKEGLAVGTHTATITVEYTNSGIATAQVSFAVGKATQDAPAQPELDTKTHDSVTLKVISANSNAAVVEYSKDNGSTYQDSNVFTGLAPNTTYNFVARYKATNDGNYKESNPSTAVQITTDNSTSGSSSGSDSGSSGTGYYTDYSSSGNTENQSTLSELKPIKVDANGKAVITKDIIKTAIAKAKADAKDGQETLVTVEIEAGTNLNHIQIILNADALSELVSSKVHRFTMDTDTVADWGLRAETLSELKKMTGGDIIFSMSKTNPTSKEAKAAIGKRPVYDISIANSKNGKETKIESLNGKTLSLSIPYTATKKEETGKLYAVYVDNQGKVEWITKSSYDKDKKALLFETNHFSIYGVGYQKTLPNFNDINNHWAKEDIMFVVSREMLSGTGSTTFSPDVKLTRGMFVTALGRLSNIDTQNYKQSKFADVKENAYYAAYVNWAEEQGIVSGTGKDTFEPDKSITREEMAVIMKNYAEKLGYTLPKTLEEIKFTDDEHISDWAKEAVKEMQKAGILAGKINNGFDPKGEATRAEASALLHRFVEIVIDPQSANGWTKNDSGQISYYKDGQAVKGWFKENGKTYWFNKKTAKMFRNGFKKIDGKTYYFYKDGTMAVNKVIKKKKIGPDGVVS